MNRDSLHEKITQALEGPIDGTLFERCAQDLLGDVFAGLAPVVGGGDGGFDGAISTRDGVFPLICTVQENAKRNFIKNAKTYLSTHDRPKKAVFATPRALTPQKRRSLEIAAKDLGIMLVGIYDGAFFADKLYRNSSWRVQLLGVTGDPPALSAIPRSGRDLNTPTLIGRDKDVAWLETTLGDLLLVGHPGSGKTYLSQHLAGKGCCLFAVDADPSRLANSIREQSPRIIAIDDAHVNLTLIEELQRLRHEVKASFSIHANCWPNHERQLKALLRLSSESIRHLTPLPPKSILAIINSMGIVGPDWLLDLLIQQSDGKPGLAAVLVDACRREHLQGLWSGEAVVGHLVDNCRLVRGQKERCVLAAFALGGGQGMPFRGVADALKIDVIDLKQFAADLGAGGLIEEVGSDRLQVRPAAIRAPLVKEVFFSGPMSLPINELMSIVPSREESSHVLLDARQRGAQIEIAVLEQLVADVGTERAWEHFAWVDETFARRVLETYPECICAAAPGLLRFHTAQTLEKLLGLDWSDNGSHSGSHTSPKQRISNWLFGSEIDDGLRNTSLHRTHLLEVIERQVPNGSFAKENVVWCLAKILEPEFDVTRTAPGDNFSVLCTRGALPMANLRQISELWPRVLAIFRRLGASPHEDFLSEVETWCLPQRLPGPGSLPKKSFDFMRRIGKRMLTDLLKLPQCNRAWKSWASEIVRWARMRMRVDVDEFFHSAFIDGYDAENWEEQQKLRIARIREFTNQLLTKSISEVVDYLLEMENEAALFGRHFNKGFMWLTFEHAAEQCKNPNDWINALLERKASEMALSPFLEVLRISNVDEYARRLSEMIGIETYVPFGVDRIIHMDEPPEPLLQAALSRVGFDVDPEKVLWGRREIPVTTMSRLLSHESPRVRASAAVNEWQCGVEKSVRKDVYDSWRIAVKDIEPSQYALEGILKSDASLAFDWMASQVSTRFRHVSRHDRSVVIACSALSVEQRRSLLKLLHRENYSDSCFDVLLGDNLELFSDWCRWQSDAWTRLRPLDRKISPRWVAMAKIALDAGVTPEELADHCTPNHWSGGRRMSQVFAPMVAAYEAIAFGEDLRLRPAGQRGLAWAKRNLEAELADERLQGYFDE